MKELIKINYENEQQIISVRELYEKLNECKDFKEFFVKVSEYKVLLDFDELKVLRDVVKTFALEYGVDAIVYLADSITTEMTIPCKSKDVRKSIEADMQKQIINNFRQIFPDFEFVASEKEIRRIGRIDIFAISNGKAVIIELKAGNKNPNSQLLAYGSKFESPILIGITQYPIEESRKLDGILYFVFDDLKKGASQWMG